MTKAPPYYELHSKVGLRLSLREFCKGFISFRDLLVYFTSLKSMFMPKALATPSPYAGSHW